MRPQKKAEAKPESKKQNEAQDNRERKSDSTTAGAKASNTQSKHKVNCGTKNSTQEKNPGAAI
ncbi:hypothetical protein PS021_24665, partial [Shigella sonnei]|nr:hypothetical protein [Shigella sonnei]